MRFPRPPRETDSVPVPIGAGGLTGRICPKCKKYFRVEFGTGLKKSNASCHCPYCEHVAPHQNFHTRDQLKYGLNELSNRTADRIFHEMEKLSKDLTQNFKHLGRFGIKLTAQAHRPVRIPRWQYREKQLETEVVCVNCTLRYAVYGVFAFCPDCGQHNSLQILIKSLEVVEKTLNLASQQEMEVAEKLIENALEDCVSAFDGFGHELCRVHADKAQVPSRAEKMSFQNLEGAKLNVLDAFGIDISAMVEPDEWRALCVGFQKRHLFSHKMGVVDREYITKTNDSQAVVGRKIKIGVDEVKQLARIICKLAQRLSDELQELGKTS